MSEIVDIKPAGDKHRVVSVKGGSNGWQRRPCRTCPWRVDAVGEFPAEAFRHSASTAYDMAQELFACHASGVEEAKTCAGFLLRGADHNMRVRLGEFQGQFGGVSDGGLELHDSYRDMAVANGVDPDDPVLDRCR